MVVARVEGDSNAMVAPKQTAARDLYIFELS